MNLTIRKKSLMIACYDDIYKCTMKQFRGKRSVNIRINECVINGKARKFASVSNINGFKAISGSLMHFCNKYGVMFQIIYVIIFMNLLE